MKALTVALGLAGWLTVGLAWAAPTGFVYTANERAESISQVQLDSGAVKTIKTGIAPHNVQVTPDGKRLLAVGVASHGAHHGSSAAGSGQLWVLETAALEQMPVVIEVGEHPAHVVTDLNAERAFVTDSAANVVRVIDLKARAETGRIPTGAYPHGLRLSPDGKTLYVANMRGGSVSVIDVDRLQETGRIAVGKGPVQVGFAPDGRQAYVSLSGSNQLGLIDTRQQRLVGKVKVGRTPIQMVSTAAGLVYVANQGSAQAPDQTVSVVDAASKRVVKTLVTGKGAHGTAISSDNAYVFVSNIEAGTFSVIDAATQEVVAEHQVGLGPNGISYQAP